MSAVDKFKDVKGRWRTMSLFAETITPDVLASGYTPLFVLKSDEDVDGLPSMKRLYMEANDPTEYKAAMSIFGAWEPWEHLCGSTFFKEEVDKWRKELHLKLQSEATAQIVKCAAEGTKMSGTQFQAAKWVAERQWEKVDAEEGETKRGRPSKEAIEREAAYQIRAGLNKASQLEEDARRAGIKLGEAA